MRAWHSGAFIVPRQDRSTVVAHRSLAVPASCVMDLDLIERYYDAAPRAAADVEEIGPFTLFVADPATGWSFYARPRPGAAADVTPDDVRRVLARQTELRVPRAVGWGRRGQPSLLPAVRAVGPTPAELALCPLLALPQDAVLPGGSG